MVGATVKTTSSRGLHRIQCLSAADIFCDLAPHEIHELSSRAPVQYVEARATIYTPDQSPELMFFLNEGRVQLYQLSTEGKLLTTALVEAGTLFGEMALLGQSMNRHFAQAVTACMLCVMTVSDVRELLLSDVRISNRLVYSLGKRLLDTQRQLSMVTLKPVLNRVAWALLYLAGSEMGPILYTTHETIASLIGATRETVTKILNEFQDDGLISLSRGQIMLIDNEALTGLAES
jgi:CRP-like cAMP-binding protein